VFGASGPLSCPPGWNQQSNHEGLSREKVAQGSSWANPVLFSTGVSGQSQSRDGIVMFISTAVNSRSWRLLFGTSLLAQCVCSAAADSDLDFTIVEANGGNPFNDAAIGEPTTGERRDSWFKFQWLKLWLMKQACISLNMTVLCSNRSSHLGGRVCSSFQNPSGRPGGGRGRPTWHVCWHQELLYLHSVQGRHSPIFLSSFYLSSIFSSSSEF
jgi:hypothetical protein